MADLTPLPPVEAIEFFRQKGFEPSFAWQDVFQEQHARVFTVAKGMSLNLLQTIRELVDKAIAEGITLEQFREELQPKLEALGWWGQSVMIDPATGVPELVQLGSPNRLRTIFEVNLRSAYAAGKWVRIQDAKKAAPYLRYVQIQRPSKRHDHEPWHGTILPVDHPWWDQHYPPCGWRCGCQAQQLSERQMARRGWTVSKAPPPSRQVPYVNPRTGERVMVEEGIAPGFGFNVGKAYLAGLAPRLLPDDDTAPATNRAQDEAELAFMDAFGIGLSDELVHVDKGGWPFVVSQGLFRDAAWRPVSLTPKQVRDLPLAAAAILEPSEIRWVWRQGADGRAMIFRRYIGVQRVQGRSAPVAMAVDVGPAGWLFVSSIDGPTIEQLRVGELAWSAAREA